jgi:hypothetical protein
LATEAMARDGRLQYVAGRLIDRLVSIAKWLVLPVALLLMFQWPARELIGRFSHEADDFGQLLFALYVAIAVTCATRRGSHLASDILAPRHPRWLRTSLARAVLAAMLAWPKLVHLGQPAEAGARMTVTPQMSDEEIRQRLDEMLTPSPE